MYRKQILFVSNLLEPSIEDFLQSMYFEKYTFYSMIFAQFRVNPRFQGDEKIY